MSAVDPRWQAYEDGYQQGAGDGSGEGYGMGKANPFPPFLVERVSGAQREAEAWEAIEAWLLAEQAKGDKPQGTQFLYFKPPVGLGGQWSSGFHVGGARQVCNHYGSDRLEALEAAAAWCRAEMAVHS